MLVDVDVLSISMEIITSIHSGNTIVLNVKVDTNNRCLAIHYTNRVVIH